MNHEWYEIRVINIKNSPNSVFVQNEKSEMIVGPHTRPAGAHGGAMIESRELAEKFAEALKPIYEKRYGQDTELTVVMCSGNLGEKDFTRVKAQSEIVKARLATGNFVPNRRVAVN